MEKLLGMRELYDVTLKTTYPIEVNGEKIEEGETIAVFDNIQMGIFGEEKDFVAATGGYDNRPRVFWEDTKDVNLNFTQGVFSKTQFALMSNSKLINVSAEKEVLLIPKREEKESDLNGIIKFTKIPSSHKKFFIYNKETGKKIVDFEKISNDEIKIDSPFLAVILDYYYDYTNGGSEMIVGQALTTGFLTLEGKTKLQDDKTGQFITAIITIPKLKIMSKLSMRLGNDTSPLVGTFNAIGCPVGKKGTKKVFILDYLNDDIDADI